jgi:AbrB family looped-hinge helix DNA binding protein
MPSAMVTFNGRITLPPDIRKQLGLKTGDSVNFVEIEKGRFEIIPEVDAIDDFSADLDSSDWLQKLDFSKSAT